MDNQKKSAVKTDFATNKILLVFILAFVMSVGLMLINRGLSNPRTFMGTYYLLYALGIIGAVGVAAGVVLGILDRVKGRDTSARFVTGSGVVICSLVLVLTSLLLLFRSYTASIRLLYILVPSLAIFYLIYVIFPREYTWLTFLGALEALFFWRYARFNQGTTLFYILQGVLLLAFVLAAVLLFLLKKNDGVLRIGGGRVRILNTDAAYIPALMYLALLTLFLIAAFFIPAGWILYLSYMTLAVIFVTAVYFAVRMM